MQYKYKTLFAQILAIKIVPPLFIRASEIARIARVRIPVYSLQCTQICHVICPAIGFEWIVERMATVYVFPE